LEAAVVSLEVLVMNNHQEDQEVQVVVDMVHVVADNLVKAVQEALAVLAAAVVYNGAELFIVKLMVVEQET
jgi:hypothetical protein